MFDYPSVADYVLAPSILAVGLAVFLFFPMVVSNPVVESALRGLGLAIVAGAYATFHHRHRGSLVP